MRNGEIRKMKWIKALFQALLLSLMGAVIHTAIAQQPRVVIDSRSDKVTPSLIAASDPNRNADLPEPSLPVSERERRLLERIERLEQRLAEVELHMKGRND